jgi:hypothetical protein
VDRLLDMRCKSRLEAMENALHHLEICPVLHIVDESPPLHGYSNEST